MNTVKKEVYLVIALNEIAWFDNENVKERLSKLPLSYHYKIRKNIQALRPMAKEFQDFRNEQEQKLKDCWFDEEHSEETKIVQQDADGKEQEVDGRKVKDVYLDDYKKELTALNEQLEKLLVETDEISFTPIDIDELVEVAGDDSITMEDVDMISFFANDSEGDE
jgi:hypothetical protein